MTPFWLALICTSGVAWLFEILRFFWWYFVAFPKFQRRCSRYFSHVKRAGWFGRGPCRCDNCDAFRAEMGWPP